MATEPLDASQARAVLAEAEALLDDARHAMMEATLVLLGTQPVWIDGVRYGGLHPLDDFLAQAIAAAIEAQSTYDAAWAQYQQARAQHQPTTVAAPRQEYL